MLFETRAIHIGEEPNFHAGGSGDVTTPIHLASTFARQKVEKPTGGYEYSRSGNPTREALERRLAALEEAHFGLAFASGSAAQLVLLLTLLRSGEHLVAFDDLYGGTRRLFRHIFNGVLRVEVSYVDARNPAKVQAAIQKNTRLIWVESPTNPLMRLCDIAALAAIARTHTIKLVVDNTFMSPYFQRPLLLGADIVMHSTTKYLNGHSDSVGGALMLSDRALYRRLKFNQNTSGAILSPFDSYLVLRGSKTLAVRMRQHQANALKIASWLNHHSKIKAVHYPGLPDHPQHALAANQMSGYGGMIACELQANLDKTARFLEQLKIFALAESLGGVESLIEHPALMTHASIPQAEREKIGIHDSLIRLSVGIENVEDLIEDLEQALQLV